MMTLPAPAAGTAPGAGNVISGNDGSGVSISGGANNAVLGNSIFSSGDLGIDLFPPGVNPNDPGDLDNGANDGQNFPVLTTATVDLPLTGIAGTLNSRHDREYRLEFFANAACDDSGNGEGKVFLGSLDVTTDGSGNASFSGSFPTASSGANDAVGVRCFTG